MNKFSLDKQPKITSGFTTPEHYFDHFPDLVLEKINEEQPKKTTVFTLKKFVVAAAAILLLALSIPYLLMPSGSSLEQIDTNSLENYITYQSTVSSYDLINLMEPHEFDAMQVDINLEDQFVEDILTTNPNFENYIID
jgi:short subunit fatty acids transporter